jgi:hypothetical protein
MKKSRTRPFHPRILWLLSTQSYTCPLCPPILPFLTPCMRPTHPHSHSWSCYNIPAKARGCRRHFSCFRLVHFPSSEYVNDQSLTYHKWAKWIFFSPKILFTHTYFIMSINSTGLYGSFYLLEDVGQLKIDVTVTTLITEHDTHRHSRNRVNKNRWFRKWCSKQYNSNCWFRKSSFKK